MPPALTVANPSARSQPAAESLPPADSSSRANERPTADARPPETSRREAAAALTLITRGARHPDEYAALIEQAGSAEAVLTQERLAAAPQTSFFADPEADLDRELDALTPQIREWQFQGMQLLTVLDARYPENLRAAAQRPALLFVAGRLKPRDQRGVAVVGCPEADRDELRAAEELAGGLARAGHTVISGLAAGVDTAAHLAALKRGGRTVAVIGTGLSRCYPRANVILQRRIAAECAVVSQFEPDAGPDGDNFAARNPVLSGMALATIVVAASTTGTTRAHARQAAAQQRPVVLFEPLLRQRWARELAELPNVHVAATPTDAIQAAA